MEQTHIEINKPKQFKKLSGMDYLELHDKFPQINKLLKPLNRQFNYFNFLMDENINRFNNSDLARSQFDILHKGNKQEVMCDYKNDAIHFNAVHGPNKKTI